jgi:hypothetical protein
VPWWLRLGAVVSGAIVGALVTAAVSTAGDYLWKNLLPHGIPIYWFAHGALLFLTVGFCLGLPSGRLLAGATGGMVVGLAATAGFAILRPLIGYAGIFVMYFALWIGLGLLAGRVLEKRDTLVVVLTRSVVASIGSGLGFYAISGIWFPFNPHGWDYAKHFVYWTIAYLPGFAALLVPINRATR